MQGKSKVSAERCSTLDGLRGVAAIMVMLFHTDGRLSFTTPHGYLAVDLFFGLSGFVLAGAYEDRFRSGLSVARFTLLRLARVYPMYLVGTVIGWLIFGGSPLALFLIPDLRTDALFRHNLPMWSLLFELIANIAYASFATRIGRRGLSAILAASGAITILGIVLNGSADIGPTWGPAGFGLARTIFSFTLGVGIYRLRGRLGCTNRRFWLARLLLPVLITALVIEPPHAMLYDLVCIFGLLPGLPWLGVSWETPHARIFQVLGDLSFPLYCIHSPFVTTYFGSLTGQIILCIGLVFVSLWLSRVYDRPVRQGLLALINYKRRSAAAIA